jgi:transcriptional regulator with XRE-family HTH domain
MQAVSSRLFSAVLRYWRGRRGLSQLDLALHAGVSARHVSFLESGRAQPSEAMVVRLMDALDVPLRDRNEALRAAGFDARFPEPALAAIPAAIDEAIERMMAMQEPYPLTVISPIADVLRSNRAANAIFSRFVADPTALGSKLNMFSLVFDPQLMRPFIANWPSVARQMLARLHRESLQRGGDQRLAALAKRALTYPDVPEAWHGPDFTQDVDPVFSVHLRRDDIRLSFFTTITTFSSPSLVTLDELRIESSFPLDPSTRAFCETHAQAPYDHAAATLAQRAP